MDARIYLTPSPEEDTVTETTRRAPSSVGNPLRVDAVVAKLLSATDGATIDAAGHPYSGDGILVAVKGQGIRVGDAARRALRDANLTMQDLLETWVESRGTSVTGPHSPARYFGVWTDHVKGEEIIYFDVVEAFSSAEEDRAIVAARARGELAVWHNGRKEEIRVPEDSDD